MKLKFIIFMGLIVFLTAPILGMYGESENYVQGSNKNEPDSPYAMVGRLIGDLVNVIRSSPKNAAQGAGNNAVLGAIKGLGAPEGADVPFSILYASNKLFGTQATNLGEIADLTIQHGMDSGVARLIGHLGGDNTENLVGAWDNVIQHSVDQCADSAFIRFNKELQSAKTAFYSIGKKVLIAGAVVGTTVIAYYLFKKLINPGSLKKNSISKSNLVVESSGFTNGIMARTMNLFRSKKLDKKLILESSIAQKVKMAVKDFMIAKNSLRKGSHAIKFKSLLLTGPQGTGKNLFVDHLIQASHLDYIKITSSTFINFEDGQESKAIASLFGLLRNPKKEVIVVFDEADILLNRPAYKDKLIDLLRLLKANNNKFMVVLCAESKKSLDSSLFALVDNTIEFALPSENEIKRFLENRIQLIVDEYGQAGLAQIITTLFDRNKIVSIAKQTNGLSYEKLELLIEQIRTDVLRKKEKFSKQQVDNAVKNSIALEESLAL